jgi:RimJ/RimL family protein N-acetyltransferase
MCEQQSVPGIGFNDRVPLNQLVAETDRLSVLPLSVSHAADLAPAMADQNLCTFLAWKPHETPLQTRTVVQSLVEGMLQGKAYHWVAEKDSRAVGLVSLIDVVRSHRSWWLGRAELAYWIAPDHWGQGLATEASRAVMGLAFERLGLHRLLVMHAADNPASGRVAQRLGFHRIGTERQAFRKNEKWHDLERYDLLAGEWQGGAISREDQR